MLKLNDPIVFEIPHRIVLTGGPLGGKSTILKKLEDRYSSKSRFMTEVASMLLTNGYPQTGKDVEYSPEWNAYINSVIIPTQINMENGHLHAAKVSNKSAVIFDRGLLDVAAYIEDGRDRLLKDYDLKLEDIFSRYDVIIHLESLACHNKDLYAELLGTNPARYENADQAVSRDKKILDAWDGHPNRFIIPAELTRDKAFEKVLDIIGNLLDREIERKWLLNAIPNSINYENSKELTQSYLVSDSNVELRIRNIDNSDYIMTIKDTGTLYRKEWEVALTSEIFDLFKLENYPSISKTRKVWKDPSGILHEFDVYHKPENLFILEVEFSSEKSANEYVLPKFLDEFIVCEVTDNSDYKNKNLALK